MELNNRTILFRYRLVLGLFIFGLIVSGMDVDRLQFRNRGRDPAALLPPSYEEIVAAVSYCS